MLGGNAGGSWGQSNVSNAFVNGTAPIANQQAIAAASPRLNPDGFTGGGQVGYNHQVDRWLFGVEADANYFGLKQSRGFTAPFPAGGSFTTTNSVTSDWLVTLRPRVGYTVDRTLFLCDRRSRADRVEFRVVANRHDRPERNRVTVKDRGRLDHRRRHRTRVHAKTGRRRSNISIPISASNRSRRRPSPDQALQPVSLPTIST